MTLELWRDPENDGERSCCSASAVRGARALAHRMGMPHFTLDLRDEFRAGVVEPFLADHDAGLTPNPCVRCNGHVRLDAMIEFADRIGAAHLATGHYARHTEDGLLRLAADPGQGPDLHARRARAGLLARLRFPLGELTKRQVRERGRPWPPGGTESPTRRTCASWPARVARRSYARHGGLADRPGDIVDGTAGSSPVTAASTTSPSASARASASAATASRSTSPPRRATPSWSGPRAELATTRVPISGLRLHRPAQTVDAAKLRYRTIPVPCRLDGDGAIDLLEPFEGAAPGQVACLLSGDAVVGCATITR